MDIYPETVIQKDQAIQADMFLAVSSPKESLPVPTMTQRNVKYGNLTFSTY